MDYEETFQKEYWQTEPTHPMESEIFSIIKVLLKYKTTVSGSTNCCGFQAEKYGCCMNLKTDNSDSLPLPRKSSSTADQGKEVVGACEVIWEVYA